ncbi:MULTISPECIES: GIY-YIG nuclease family protein [Nostocales]|uniref:GIY-YIG nuclease family protein n=3 Tax=Nostocales TaxID=1161 RepID=A0A0C1NBD5_9CYAN|nr:GIY-YIG nuclease family protein [Tolypothrix bouteillei]KAF3890608.1 GIY-YIG nuclease family protein [Tolypothrix bouteillei VB521301]
MDLIAFNKIDPKQLPSLPIEWSKAFPECSAVYFVLSQHSEVLYIGSSINLSQRWLQHHKQQELEKLKNLRLAWIEINDEILLRKAETRLIEYFKNQKAHQIRAIFRRSSDLSLCR